MSSRYLVNSSLGQSELAELLEFNENNKDSIQYTIEKTNSSFMYTDASGNNKYIQYRDYSAVYPWQETRNSNYYNNGTELKYVDPITFVKNGIIDLKYGLSASSSYGNFSHIEFQASAVFNTFEITYDSENKQIVITPTAGESHYIKNRKSVLVVLGAPGGAGGYGSSLSAGCGGASGEIAAFILSFNNESNSFIITIGKPAQPTSKVDIYDPEIGGTSTIKTKTNNEFILYPGKNGNRNAPGIAANHFMFQDVDEYNKFSNDGCYFLGFHGGCSGGNKKSKGSQPGKTILCDMSENIGDFGYGEAGPLFNPNKIQKLEIKVDNLGGTTNTSSDTAGGGGGATVASGGSGGSYDTIPGIGQINAGGGGGAKNSSFTFQTPGAGGPGFVLFLY